MVNIPRNDKINTATALAYGVQIKKECPFKIGDGILE